MKTIAQRELQNHSGDVLRRVERGQQFVISVDGRPVAVLTPFRKRQWVSKAEYAQVLGAGPEDPGFFSDIADMGALHSTSTAAGSREPRHPRHVDPHRPQ